MAPPAASSSFEEKPFLIRTIPLERTKQVTTVFKRGNAQHLLPRATTRPEMGAGIPSIQGTYVFPNKNFEPTTNLLINLCKLQRLEHGFALFECIFHTASSTSDPHDGLPTTSTTSRRSYPSVKILKNPAKFRIRWKFCADFTPLLQPLHCYVATPPVGGRGGKGISNFTTGKTIKEHTIKYRV